jgi:hypothetical protein
VNETFYKRCYCKQVEDYVEEVELIYSFVMSSAMM